MLQGIALTRRRLHHLQWPVRPDGLDQDRGQVDEEEYVTPEATRRAVQRTRGIATTEATGITAAAAVYDYDYDYDYEMLLLRHKEILYKMS